MTLAQDLVTVDGLPVHPLLVHAVVVLLPLSALGAVLIAVRPAWRRRYGLIVGVLTVVAVAAVPVVEQTGEQLRDRLVASGLRNPLVDEHAELGDAMLLYALLFGVLVLALLFVGRITDRSDGTTRLRVLTVVLSVLVILSGVAATVHVVRVGHSGSEAVWEGVAGG